MCKQCTDISEHPVTITMCDERFLDFIESTPGALNTLTSTPNYSAKTP